MQSTAAPTDRTGRERNQLSLRVMGTVAQIVTVGSGPSPNAVAARLEDLQRRWSRFDPDSELSRFGRSGGTTAILSPDTVNLLERCVTAWHLSSGRFDPTVIDALEALGYDRDFELIRTAKDSLACSGSECVSPPTPAVNPSCPAPGLGGLRVDPVSGLVQAPAGVRVDPGGLGKGLAADMAATEAVAAAEDGYGIMVSVGGDLRVAGVPPSEGWEVEIDRGMGAPARINLRSGALATSSVLRRRWSVQGHERHHVIDPRTGLPCRSDAASVSVVAAEAWRAEVLATVLLLDLRVDGSMPPAGPGSAEERLLRDAGALVTFHDGRPKRVGAHAGAFAIAEEVRAVPFSRRPSPADQPSGVGPLEQTA